MVVFSCSSATAAPTKIDDRVEYSASLNTIASVVMTWYGSLIKPVKSNGANNTIPVNFNARHTFDTINNKWSKYRSHYPPNIKKILISNTQLLKQKNEYHFIVNSIISFTQDETSYSKSLKEVFVFSHLILTKAINIESPIISVKLINNRQQASESGVGYDREHYKVTEFIYAWLSHLDGKNTLNAVMNADAWFDKAKYTLNAGADISTGSVTDILKQRNKLLAKGGHLLRSLNVKKSKDDNTLILELILEWEGVNEEGIPVIAKIKQDIKIQIKTDKSWEVISIKEKHLLPDIAPWMGLLC